MKNLNFDELFDEIHSTYLWESEYFHRVERFLICVLHRIQNLLPEEVGFAVAFLESLKLDALTTLQRDECMKIRANCWQKADKHPPFSEEYAKWRSVICALYLEHESCENPGEVVDLFVGYIRRFAEVEQDLIECLLMEFTLPESAQ
jgi:hypothetical protein